MTSKKTSQKDSTYDYLCKSIIVGDSGVGKTNIVLRFTEDNYKNCHTATIGVDFKVKVMDVDNTKIKLQVWDTAGQCKFRNITKTYFKGAMGAIFAYAIDDRNSFESISDWIRQANENSDAEQVRILVANKEDMGQESRRVQKSQGEELARKYNMKFLEVSAKSGQNIDRAFMEMGREMKKFVKQDDKVSHQFSEIQKKKDGNRKKCCQ